MQNPLGKLSSFKHRANIVLLMLLAAPVFAQVNYTPYVFTTLADRAGVAGNQDGQGTNALFDSVLDLSVDSAGNVYACDALSAGGQNQPGMGR